MDLDELLLRTSRGDSGGYADLYDQAGGLVYGIVLRVDRASSIAEEVCQGVFAEIWRLAPRFDPERGTATAWIGTLAHRRAVDRVRLRAAHRDRTEYIGRPVTTRPATTRSPRPWGTSGRTWRPSTARCP